MGAIERAGKQELAWNGKPARNTEEEITEILAPMFTLFPSTNADENTFAIYVRMLRDVEVHSLAAAVLKAMNSCKFLPTIADIREQLESRAPGPRSDVDPARRKPVPQRMFRLDDDEDRRLRLERLRQTKGWDKHYA